MSWRQPLWFVVLLSLLLVSLMASWHVHERLHYSYDIWYDVYDIGEHIDHYGPRNKYIHGLNDLSKADHVYLFNQISDAVHSGGKGLADIQFTDKFGKTKALLHDSEIVHLQDVANLIDKLDLAGAIALLILLAGLIILRIHKVRPRWKVQLGIFVGLLILVGVVVLMAGPTAVFYQLHVWIFPDNHQWFFYYQESLMSTMMKAPILFGGIAATLVGLGLLIFVMVLLLLIRRFKF
ncbi:DUF1461 domain-containing protein [Thalassolituus oleivorans]|uniref:lipoprotein intramolecular transacylase Lit n=1 Tax=Thalassolituus oleivorans TaxID=187493 RepID=UPI00042DB8FD|nr:DUF1461 domain-containing protein [Thalassolituus oleivorans]AHK15809.1 hypothetical protein R615_08515 [Thalassolituus oleivorans R6-15]MCA6128646.1 hypothetical protein [Thalassolituus oleivorans 4BN06-13]